MKKVTNAVNAVHGKRVIPIFFDDKATPYIGKAFWDSLCLRDDLFKEPETQQVLHEDERVNRTEFVRVSTFPDVISALHHCRNYIRYFEYISDEDIDDLSEALSHWVKEEAS
ncbi:hypothetical protein MPK66_gp283 [Erwinia phage pEa_SNUABM_2]|uniref:Uncharacterized protein n=1 Tax=Erwinia phage pEa_SNUABM_2 TaxID=2869547 RepID=A0AAE7XNP2_9CAUD|nr:hypothetical protein MPK66_gp283 [Erwinia phage pEa_SNUABM_2]QZE59527.1 hypothetical protein pEaSNUABM2_00283 [Erwinia phage pEa_SNUABM_2]QZE59864.1 hypothetical protein pEaSNUABM39_00284 [Erwinia phage pEa_SNUABM_39]